MSRYSSFNPRLSFLSGRVVVVIGVFVFDMEGLKDDGGRLDDSWIMSSERRESSAEGSDTLILAVDDASEGLRSSASNGFSSSKVSMAELGLGRLA